MKRFLGIMAVAALVVSTALAGDNPLAGKAVDQNGKPYLLGYVLNETSSGWMAANANYTQNLWERAGGEFRMFASDYDLNREVSMMNDLMQMKPQAIMVHPSDSFAIAPAVKSAMDAGYPVFAVDMGVEGTPVTSYIHHNQRDLGKAVGEYFVKTFNKDNPARILELAGGLEQNGAQQRQEGFHKAIAGIDYLNIVQVIDTGWSSDTAFSGIQDAFQRNPDINAIYTHSDFMLPGILEGLRVQGKLIPAGQPGHLIFGSIDADQRGLQAIRDGYCDVNAENNPVLHAAVAINVILAHIYGQPIVDDYTLKVNTVTKDNVNDPDRWANLPEGKYKEWPVLKQDIFPIPSR